MKNYSKTLIGFKYKKKLICVLPFAGCSFKIWKYHNRYIHVYFDGQIWELIYLDKFWKNGNFLSILYFEQRIVKERKKHDVLLQRKLCSILTKKSNGERPMRAQEQRGTDYRFIVRLCFERMTIKPCVSAKPPTVEVHYTSFTVTPPTAFGCTVSAPFLCTQYFM